MAAKRRRLLLAGAAAVLWALGAAAQTPPSLGAAASFAAFGSSGVTNSGPTHVTGNLGASVTGFPPGIVDTGDIIKDEGTLREAQRDAAAAYAQLAALPCTVPVYCVSALDTPFILPGNAFGLWIVRVTGSVTTPNNFSVQLPLGATSSNVFWQIDGTLTIGENSAFVGTILARNDIHLLHAAALSGRALAPNGVVTFDTNDVTFCCDPLTFTPETLPPLKFGEPYAQTITVSGGTPPYVISLFAGTPPPGLQLAPNGTLSGTPTTHDDLVFTVRAVDTHGCSSVHTYTICNTIALSLEPKADPKACVAYTRNIVADGGRPPYRFVVSGLPPGFTGTLAGTPTEAAPGDYKITIEATDSLGCTASATFPLHVACGLMLPSAALPNGTAGVPYHAKIGPLCGLAPFTYTVGSIISPSPPNGGMPPGLSLPTPEGDIDGTPASPGVYTFSVTVTDARGCTDTRSYSITICAAPRPDITLPNGTICAQYDYGPIPGTLVDPKTLPPGLNIVGGRLTGVPTKKGMFRFTMQLAAPTPLCPADTQSYIVTIDCAKLQFPDLQPLSAGVAMSQALEPPFCLPFQVTGTLPRGLTLDDPGFPGLLHGTPQPGKFHFTISTGDPDCPASRDYEGEVPEPCVNALALSPPSVPGGTVGVFYSQVFTANGATTFQLLPPNAQPPGLTFAPSGPGTATLSGFPSTPGRFNIVVVASNGQCTTSQIYEIAVGPPPIPPPPIPALSPWMLLVLAVALAIAAARRIS
jgi:hypothetical protein